MTQYFVTAWCERPFYAQCEVDAETPEEAVEKARTAIDDEPAEACDGGYYWDEWRVDTAEQDGVLLHLDAAAAVRAAAPKLLEALKALASTARTFRNVPKEELAWTSIDDAALDAAFQAIDEAEGRAA